jgi:hypothetical protein
VLIWVLYLAVQTGIPSKPAANVARLAPGFVPQFSGVALVVAIASTLAWLWLVRWRTARHRTALWRSLVLPAGGVLLAWSLLMTLGLPLLDYARSYRAHVSLLGRHIPAHACIAAPTLSRALIAALEYHGRWRVEAFADPARTDCPILLLPGTVRNEPATPPGWQRVAVERRPTDKEELSVVYRRP